MSHADTLRQLRDWKRMHDAAILAEQENRDARVIHEAFDVVDPYLVTEPKGLWGASRPFNSTEDTDV